MSVKSNNYHQPYSSVLVYWRYLSNTATNCFVIVFQLNYGRRYCVVYIATIFFFLRKHHKKSRNIYLAHADILYTCNYKGGLIWWVDFMLRPAKGIPCYYVGVNATYLRYLIGIEKGGQEFLCGGNCVVWYSISIDNYNLKEWIIVFNTKYNIFYIIIISNYNKINWSQK